MLLMLIVMRIKIVTSATEAMSSSRSSSIESRRRALERFKSREASFQISLLQIRAVDQDGKFNSFFYSWEGDNNMNGRITLKFNDLERLFSVIFLGDLFNMIANLLISDLEK